MPADNNGTISKKNSILKKIEEESAEELDEGKLEDEEEANLKIWDCGSPLYDSYELVALSHLIDRHLMEFPYQTSRSHESSHSSSRILVQPKEEVAASKKLKLSSKVMFYDGLVEKKEKDNADGERRKKMKWRIAKICSRIISWKKINCLYKDN